MATPPEGTTATCKHCRNAITWAAVTIPGYVERNGWSDGHPRYPFYCPSALNMSHVPEEAP